jgi:nucleoid-associated protein YgaU
MPESGALRKLKITGYTDKSFDESALAPEPNPIEVMINPKGYSMAMGIFYTKEQAAGGSGKAVAFNRNKGEAFDLALTLDGTGTVPDAPDKPVNDQLADLRRLMYEIDGEEHSPNFVKLNWGTMTFKGRLKTLNVDYTLFAPDGSPLRATVKAGFIGFHEHEDYLKAQNLRSPDLTRAVLVEAGQTLPLLCHRIYGDSRYYLAVAAHNRLDDFRTLAPGTMLLFPPLAGAGS